MSEVGIYVLFTTVLYGLAAWIWRADDGLNLVIKFILALCTLYGGLLMFVRGVW